MAQESFIQVDEGSARKLHTYQRTVGGEIVEQSVTVLGEPWLPTYRVHNGGTSTGTDKHFLQVMAGGTKVLILRRIAVYQNGLASSNKFTDFDVRRLTTAGTGGTSRPVNKLNTSDPDPGASSLGLPTSQGTVGDRITIGAGQLVSAYPASPGPLFAWEPPPGSPAAIIPAGGNNGFAVIVSNDMGGGSILVEAVFAESTY